MNMISCPFCSASRGLLRHAIVPNGWRVECHECGATGPVKTSMSEATRWWNGRYDTQILERIGDVLLGYDHSVSAKDIAWELRLTERQVKDAIRHHQRSFESPWIHQDDVGYHL